MRIPLSSLMFAAAASALAAELPPMPRARAPFERGGAARMPVKMEVKAFSYGTNLWQGVAFVSGTKRLVVSGADRSVDNNNPLRFGRLFLMNGRILEATLVLKSGGLWDGKWVLPEDALAVDAARNRATWSRPYVRPDGKPAVFSYAVTGHADATVTVDYDMGLTQEEALAQTNALAVCSSFTVGQAVGAQSAFGFGDVVHEMYPREKLIAEKQSQIHRAVENPSGTSVFNFEKGNGARHWSLSFPTNWVPAMRIFDFLGEERNGKVLRGTTLHYGMADFRKGNPRGFAVKGRLVFDLGTSAVLKQEGHPAVGGIDFWAEDAVHVPVLPSRNLLQNGGFEQDLKGWRWDDWGAVYTPAEKPREEVVADAKVGRHALLLRGTQPQCPALCSAPMALVAGRKYTVSCWAKSLSGRKVGFAFRVRSVNQAGKYWQFRGLKDFPAQSAEKEWTRKTFTFEADAGGFWVQLAPPYGAEEGVLIDGIQVEEGGTATDFDELPYVANLVSNNPYNDFRPGDDFGLKLDVQAFDPGRPGKVRARIYNFYHELKYDRVFSLGGDAVLPLDVDPVQLGTGVFVVRLDYELAASAVQPSTFNLQRSSWSDYARFSVLKPHDGTGPMAHFYANHAWYNRVSRCPHYMEKFVEWGWTATDGARNHAGPVKEQEERLGIRNFVHPVTYEPAKMKEVAARMLPPEEAKAFAGDKHAWTEAKPAWLAAMEQAAYELAKECDPKDDVWTFWNEEESWARKVGFDVHVQYVMAVRRGVTRAFAERGLPPPRFSESHGTSHYFAGRNYDAIDGYLKAANDRGFKYDVVAIHPYQNIDGGTLGPKDADLETQHLIDQMKRHGYPDSTPIFFTECFNMLPYRIPQWGADGWGDSYRCNTQSSQDRGNREFVMAASQARLYILALKYWPKVQLVHPWNCNPVLDLRFTPLSFVLSVNTVRHLLPNPTFVGDAQPYGDVRGYCFRQGGRAVMPVWTTNHDVEWGVKGSPVVRMELPKDTRAFDLEGNERKVSERVPLTPAPLFLVSKDAAGLLKALREAVAEDPATALALDVRPDATGAVNLVVRNETKAEQKGVLGVNGGEVPYALGPRAKTEVKVADGSSEPMRLQEWKGRFSILPQPWSLKYVLVPKCGAKPDWDKVPALPLDTVKAEGTWRNPGFKATYQAAWNAEAFFVRVEVEDPVFVSSADVDPGEVQAHPYAHDGGLEIHFDGFGDARSQGEKHPDLNDSRYDLCGNLVKRMLAVNWQLAQGTQSATDQEIMEKLSRRFTRTEKGYVYEVAFAARYMAPIDLKPGTVAGLGLAVHDWNPDPKAKGGRAHATVSNATRPGQDLNMKPYLLPLMVLVGE